MSLFRLFRKRQSQVHRAVRMQCVAIDYAEKRLCGAPLCLVLDIGPTVFRCAQCDALWCVDPISEDDSAEGIIIFEDMDGHRLECFDQKRSRPLFALQYETDEGRAFLIRKQGHSHAIHSAT